MLDRTKYSRTYFCRTEHDRRIAINSQQFRSLVPYENGICEINAAYRSIKIEVPNYVANYVLQTAKKILTSFMYDFILRFIPVPRVALCLTDTDSCYCMFNTNTVQEAVREEMKEDFISLMENHCSKKGKHRHPDAVLPRTCCSDCALVDAKYPGLWKVCFLRYI